MSSSTTHTDPTPRDTADDSVDSIDHDSRDLNRDAITGEPGSHPIGAGVGAASGAATGAVAGSLGGPIGAGIGGVAGAIVGGLIGKGIGEAVDPTEDEYWRARHADTDYYRGEYTYDDYEPAYRLGYNAADASEEAHTYDEADAQLEKLYGDRRGESRLEYDLARPAVREAYERRMQQRRAKASV